MSSTMKPVGISQAPGDEKWRRERPEARVALFVSEVLFLERPDAPSNMADAEAALGERF
jgi:hypothetical protein